MKIKGKYADKFVGGTPKRYAELGDMHKRVLEIFSKYKFDRILDVGCGDGNFSILLKDASNAKEVYGIEISEKGVESARRNGVKALQLDIDEDDFPFEDDYFDAIFAGEVIEHLWDPDHLFDELYRTLRRGGLCVITTPNLASIHNRIALLFGFQPWTISVSLRHAVGHLYEVREGDHIPWADHIRGFTYRALIQLLRIHKLRVIKVKGSHTFAYYSTLSRTRSFPFLFVRIGDWILA
ncbi:methyltransferase domain-containing protein, partial [Dehalococcoidia bacterium]|nr:methyltransferase domain-containing protein [Dehalococcoidia bacterium]